MPTQGVPPSSLLTPVLRLSQLAPGSVCVRVVSLSLSSLSVSLSLSLPGCLSPHLCLSLSPCPLTLAQSPVILPFPLVSSLKRGLGDALPVPAPQGRGWK